MEIKALNLFFTGTSRKYPQVEISAPTEVWEVLKNLGRTEDVKFSPSNRKLAVTGFRKNKILVFDVEISASTSSKKVALTDFIEIASSSLYEPHGIFFIDENTLVVANRLANTSIFNLPESGSVDRNLVLTAVHTIAGDEILRLQSPGSVSVSQIGQGLHEVLICNNYKNCVTRHILETGDKYVVRSNEILLSKGLSTPDGVAFNKSGRWIAISNHDTQSVFLYENTPRLNKHSEPSGILYKVNYPHGVRFTPDDNFVIVADAGSPYINIYAKDGDSWSGARDPVTTLRVLDETSYRRGRIIPQEGGTKGIDVDNDMNILVTTSEYQTLAFFDLQKILNRRVIPLDWHKQTVLWLMDRYILWRVDRIKGKLRRHLKRKKNNK